MWTEEATNRGRDRVLADFAIFDSPAEGLAAFGDFLRNNPRYAQAEVFDTNDPEAMIRRTHRAGYAAARNRSNQEIRILREIRPQFQQARSRRVV